MDWADVGNLPGSVKLGDDCHGVRRNGRSLTLRRVAVGTRLHLVAEVNVCDARGLVRPSLAIELGGLTVVNESWVLRHATPLETVTTEELEDVLDALSGEATRLAGAPTRRSPDTFSHFAT